ncbi:MAG: copper transporter [Clostridiales bacterium]|nr:copper transporter [Clostridiales bacterium]MCF8021195.1 copper transporter [Clostridiales bacterium]
MIDLKYHIASLVAVFLALGIGILIGSTMLGNDTLVEYQKQVTDNLENQLKELRHKNDSIRADVADLKMNLQIQKDFNSGVMPALINNELKGLNLAVVETSGYYFPHKLTDTLKMSGANVTSISSFLNFSPGNINKILKKINYEEKNKAKEDFLAFAARKITREIISGDMDLVNTLTGANVIQVQGKYGKHLDGVILVGGSQDKDSSRFSRLDKNLIDVFQSNEIPVYGTEETSAGYSYIKKYQEHGLKVTVDNINTVPGRTALIFSISGDAGYYGVKSSARRLMPELNASPGSE